MKRAAPRPQAKREASYRLVWFQHFHKAAGTSVIELARRNGERFHPRHDNGNRLGEDGRPLPLWRLGPAELAAFVDDCQRGKVSFVATEWGEPALETLAADPRVVLVSCLREPLQRMVSNFYYDLYGGFTPVRCLEAYPDSSWAPFCRHNYYCRMLAGKAEDADEVAEEDFLRACARLPCFDYCGVVEQGLEPLARHLGWTAHGIHENRSGSVLGLIQDFRRRHFSGLKDRIANPKRPPDAAFCADFDRSNPWDLRLYDMVKVAQEGADR
jgi:hypothetical protein